MVAAAVAGVAVVAHPPPTADRGLVLPGLGAMGEPVDPPPAAAVGPVGDDVGARPIGCSPLRAWPRSSVAVGDEDLVAALHPADVRRAGGGRSSRPGSRGCPRTCPPTGLAEVVVDLLARASRRGAGQASRPASAGRASQRSPHVDDRSESFISRGTGLWAWDPRHRRPGIGSGANFGPEVPATGGERVLRAVRDPPLDWLPVSARDLSIAATARRPSTRSSARSTWCARSERGRARPRPPRLPVRRLARDRQDLAGEDPRPLAQLRERAHGRRPAASASRAPRSPPAPRST